MPTAGHMIINYIHSKKSITEKSGSTLISLYRKSTNIIGKIFKAVAKTPKNKIMKEKL